MKSRLGGIGSGLWPLLLRDLRIYRAPGLMIFYLATPIFLIYLYHDMVELVLKAIAQGEQKNTAASDQELVTGFSIFFAFLLSGPLAAHIALQRQSGYWNRLLVAPIWRPSIILSMALSTLIVGFVQTLVVFGFGWWVYSMDLGNNIPALLITVLVYLTVPAGFGVLIASLYDDPRPQSQVITPIVAVFSALGGALIAPWFVLPEWLQPLRYISPQFWAKEGYVGLMAEDKGWLDILPNISILLLVGILLFMVGLARFQRREYL